MKKTLLSLFALTASLVGFAANPNPFAYAVSGEYDALTLDVAYSLNTAADKAEVQILKNGTVVKTQEVSATAGENTAEIDLSGLADGDYTWQIAVTGGATTGDAVEFLSIVWNHPRGVDTDRNFESPAFGNIYVTEGRASTTAKYYSTGKGGNGLYIFTPDLENVANTKADNTGATYAFMGGLSTDQKIADESGFYSNGADLSRVRVAEDGRIFVTRLNDSGSYICVAKSAEDLIENNEFTSLLGEGTVSTEDYGFYNGNDFIAGPNLAFDIKGSGEDLKIASLSALRTLWVSGASASSYAHEYELGTENTLPTPTTIDVFHKHLSAAPQRVSICYDNKGGIWYSQQYGSPSKAVPLLVYVDATGTEKYREYSSQRMGCGIRYSPDFSQLVMSTSSYSFTIYDVTYKEDGTPVLTENKVVNYTYKNNDINDFAWDLAGNIYAVSNGGEYVKGFAIPRADNTFATKAASKYNFTVDTATGVETIGTDNAPVEYYNLQGVKVENPENGIFIKKQGNKAVKVIL